MNITITTYEKGWGNKFGGTKFGGTNFGGTSFGRWDQPWQGLKTVLLTGGLTSAGPTGSGIGPTGLQ
jgi:hypothetical protein